MISVVALTQNCWLVPYSPNTDNGLKLTARLAIDAQRRLTARQSRRPQARLLRFKFVWQAAMQQADFAAARAAAIASQDEPILVPFWPAARPTAAASPVTSSLIIAWTQNWASYAISPGSLAGYDYFAPLLWGRFTQPPRLAGKSSDYVIAEFSVEEDAPAGAAITMPTSADVTFPTLDGYEAAVFPFKPDPAQDTKPALASYDVTRKQLGPGRQQSSIFWPQIPEQAFQPTFKFKSSADAISLLAWWSRRAGGADCFWVASTQSIGSLSADFASGGEVVPSVAAVKTRVGDTLALVTTGQDPEFVRVNSIAGGTVTLSAPTAATHKAAWTSICPALLAVHTDKELTIDFRRADTDWVAAATIGFREVAPEYSIPTDGETRGTTMGRLPAAAWFARVDLDYSGATQSWFLTNYEGGVTTSDGQVWTYHDFSFGKVTQSADMGDDNATFKILWWDGCPFENWQPGALSATGTLKLLKAAVASDGTVPAPTQVWQGNLSVPAQEGPMLSVTVLGMNSMMGQKAPQQLMVPPCYKALYGPRCGLNLADWQFSAVVVAIAGQSVTLGTFAAMGSFAPAAGTGGLPNGFGFKDWFTLGWLQWNDTNGNPLRAEIIASAAIAGGQIVMTLGRVPGFTVGATIIAVPGCDRLGTTCYVYDAFHNATGKFNNYNKHGGFFDMPAISPNFIIPQSTSTPAKK